jgi:Na+/H+ antiporter NhaD/arsenite permease-like protein
VFLLLGMMVIISVMRETGIFEYLAIWAAKNARGRPFPLIVLLIIIAAAASALLDNVTTVLLVAPVTILLCQRLALPVVPYLLAEVFASNIGGTATLIGDPPNIIIASRGGLSFNDFLIDLAPGRGRSGGAAHRVVPLAVRRCVPHRRAAGGGDHGARRTRSDQ